MPVLEARVRPMRADMMPQVTVVPGMQEFQNEPFRIETQPRQWKYLEDQIENEKRDPNYMEIPWGAFGQIMLAQEMDGPNGGKVKKVVAISIPYPSGTTGGMAKEIMRRTFQNQEASFAEWDGEKEGKLVATQAQLPDGEIDLSVVRRFIDASSDVLADRHAYPDSESVQHFFSQDQTRRDQLATIETDAKRILGTSEFLGISAFNPTYEKSGIILMEYYIDEAKNWWGVNPKQEKSLVVDVASNAPHKRLLSWGEDALSQPGNVMVGDADSSEDVHLCDGVVASGGCSDFFRAQEEGFDTLTNTAVSGEKAIFTTTTHNELTHTSLHKSWGVSSWVEPKQEGCEYGHAKGKCHCQISEEASGGE